MWSNSRDFSRHFLYGRPPFGKRLAAKFTSNRMNCCRIKEFYLPDYSTIVRSISKIGRGRDGQIIFTLLRRRKLGTCSSLNTFALTQWNLNNFICVIVLRKDNSSESFFTRYLKFKLFSLSVFVPARCVLLFSGVFVRVHAVSLIVYWSVSWKNHRHTMTCL